MKTKEELNAIKEEFENLNRKLAELTEDELKKVTGGNSWNEYWGEDSSYHPKNPSHFDDDFRPSEGGGNHWLPYYGEY